MAFYWGLWVFVCFLGCLGLSNAKYSRKVNAVFYVFLVVLAAIIGAREYVGSDWGSYKQFYEAGYDMTGRDQMEFLFQFIRDTLFKLGFTYGFFSFIIALMSLTALYKALELAKINNYWIAFLVYLSMFFCHYQLNVIRHGALASFVLLAYVYRANGFTLKGLFCLLIGVGFHKIGLFFLLFYPFINKTINTKILLLALGIGLGFFAVGISRFFTPSITLISAYLELDGYLDIDRWGTVGLSVGLIGKLFIFLYAYFFNKELYESNSIFRTSVNLLLISVVFNLALAQYAVIVERLVNAISMSLVIVIPYLISNTRGQNKYLLSGLFFLYLFLYYPIVWNREEADMLPFITHLSNLF